jgi:membrane protein DedA with SNARE-associated domain
MLDAVSQIQWFLGALPAGDNSTWILLLALFFGTFLSEDATCVAAGTLAANGQVSFGAAVYACFLGIIAGDLVLYLVGRAFGGWIVSSRVFNRLVSERALRRGSDWLEKRGASAVFLSRFVTGLRLPTYLAAGILGTNFFKFAIYFVIAAAIWTPLIVGAAAFWQTAVPGNLIIGILVAFLTVRIAIKLADWKTRRLLVGRIKRAGNWEFWPIWLFYIPVVFYILLLGLRYRGLTVFTATNPAIPGGGFVGESKDAIYRMIGASKAASAHLLRHCLIDARQNIEQKIAAADKFISEHDLRFPIAVKPDKGERGKGVVIVRTRGELGELLAAEGDVIVQEFFAGDEASVFYQRFPGETRGSIFSITEKRFPLVVGDGTSDVETLILRDRRSVCMAKKYLEHNSGRLDHVPEAGEGFGLIDIGTHSRGAIFLDGSHLRTAELEQKIDEICRGIDGFHFGRFDIRARSFADLRRGENFRIIELNGVTSESTNIYDPQYSLLDAYRILFAQWRTAFEIGSRNVKLGIGPAGVRFLAGSYIESLGLFKYSPRARRFFFPIDFSRAEAVVP